jgi:hypothetical protein
MSGETKVAWAEYDTLHNGRERACTGTIVMTGDETFLLRERIQTESALEERSRVLSLSEAKTVLNDWIALEIAEVVQIPWD